jgi:hypothetical protein
MIAEKKMTRPEATAVARAARTLAKHRRWAEEMRVAGWTVTEPDRDPDFPLLACLVRAAGGMIRLPFRSLLDPPAEVSYVDDPMTGDRIFRSKP